MLPFFHLTEVRRENLARLCLADLPERLAAINAPEGSIFLPHILSPHGPDTALLVTRTTFMHRKVGLFSL